MSWSPARLQADKSTSAMAYPQGEIRVPGIAERGRRRNLSPSMLDFLVTLPRQR
jgi:hypothetical protein